MLLLLVQTLVLLIQLLTKTTKISFRIVDNNTSAQNLPITQKITIDTIALNAEFIIDLQVTNSATVDAKTNTEKDIFANIKTVTTADIWKVKLTIAGANLIPASDSIYLGSSYTTIDTIFHLVVALPLALGLVIFIIVLQKQLLLVKTIIPL